MIAYVAGASSNGTILSGTNLTFSANATGVNYLVVYVYDNAQAGLANITSVTYNGVAMTQLAYFVDGISRPTAAYGLANPATGSNTVSITRSNGSNELCGASEGYSGTGITTGNTNSSYTASSGTTYSIAVTVDQDSWLVGSFYAGNDNIAATTGAKRQQWGLSNIRSSTNDSNGSLAAGSQSLGVTCNSSDRGALAVELKEASASNSGFLQLM